MIVDGSLLDTVLVTPGVGVLVIDEYVDVPAFVAGAQGRVLSTLGHLPTWAFTNHGRPLRAGLPPFGKVVDKPNANAFVRTGLYREVKAAGVRHLVVMGYHRDACVAGTIGHLWVSAPHPESYGAVNLGLTVHTHLHLVHGGPESKKRDRPLWYAAARIPEIPDGKRVRIYRRL